MDQVLFWPVEMCLLTGAEVLAASGKKEDVKDVEKDWQKPRRECGMLQKAGAS